MAGLEQYCRRKQWTREEVATLSEVFPEQRFYLKDCSLRLEDEWLGYALS